MSFFTSLTGLKAANTELAVTSNNIANAGTTGFKKSKASFGDIFARSPLQTSSVGQGVALKTIKQEFSQGSIEFSANMLDLAITGDGFFSTGVSRRTNTNLLTKWCIQLKLYWKYSERFWSEVTCFCSRRLR
jgi:flagellar hook-basal body protein